MQKSKFAQIETASDSDSVCGAETEDKPHHIVLPIEWPPPDEDVTTVRSTSPITIDSPSKGALGDGDIDHQEFENAWKRMQTLRSHVDSLRSRMNEIRRSQRRIHEKQSDADNVYLSLIRRRQVAGESLDHEIENAFRQLETLRFEYSDGDHSYESLRAPLQAAEMEQMRMEYQFYKNLELAKNSAHGTGLNWSSRSSVSSDDSEKDHHPLRRDYETKAGEVQNIKEELAERDIFHAELEYEQELRRGVGRVLQPLQPFDEEFLLNYPAERAQLLKNLQIAREDAEKARQRCIEAGVSPDGSSSDEESGSDEEDIPTEISLSPNLDNKILRSEDGREHVEDVEEEDPSIRETRVTKAASTSSLHSLIATQNNTNGSSNLRFIDYIYEKTSPGNYVNLWLLHKLQSSRNIEVELMRRIAEPYGVLVGNAVQKWFDDDTSEIPSPIYTDPDINSTKTPPRHPFQDWDMHTPYVPTGIGEGVSNSMIISFFDPFVFSARIQPKGLLRSTTDPAHQELEFRNFFSFPNSSKKKKRQWNEQNRSEKQPHGAARTVQNWPRKVSLG